MPLTIVYVVGVFDLFHRGHVELLRRAKTLGDGLVVAVNGDALTSQYKRPPLMREGDRLEIVRACRFVDEAFIINDFDNKPHILKYGIKKIVHGDDWTGDSYLEQIRLTPAFVAENGIELVFLPYWRGISTSDLIQAIAGRPPL